MITLDKDNRAAGYRIQSPVSGGTTTASPTATTLGQEMIVYTDCYLQYVGWARSDTPGPARIDVWGESTTVPIGTALCPTGAGQMYWNPSMVKMTSPVFMKAGNTYVLSAWWKNGTSYASAWPGTPFWGAGDHAGSYTSPRSTGTGVTWWYPYGYWPGSPGYVDLFATPDYKQYAFMGMDPPVSSTPPWNWGRWLSNTSGSVGFGKPTVFVSNSVGGDFFYQLTKIEKIIADIPPRPDITPGDKQFTITLPKAWMPDKIKEWDLQFQKSTDNSSWGDWYDIGTFPGQAVATDPIESLYDDNGDNQTGTFVHLPLDLTAPLPFYRYRYKVRTEVDETDWSDAGFAGRLNSVNATDTLDVPNVIEKAAPTSKSTTLPLNPSDGQRVVFQTTAMKTAGVAWTFAYQADTGKWLFMGGPPLTSTMIDPGPQTSGWTSSVWPNVPITLTGTYDVQAQGTVNNSADAICLFAPGVNSTTPPNPVRVDVRAYYGAAPNVTRRYAVTAGDVVRGFSWCNINMDTSGPYGWVNAETRITPVFVTA